MDDGSRAAAPTQQTNAGEAVDVESGCSGVDPVAGQRTPLLARLDEAGGPRQLRGPRCGRTQVRQAAADPAASGIRRRRTD